MTSLFVSKARKVKFEVYCHVHDLTNLPYVSGLYYVKWKLKQGGSSEGTTAKCVVKDHTVNWDASFRLEPTMIIGKDGVLLPCELTLYVRQLVGRSSEDVGRVSINLAEYAASRSKSKRFLLQESRLNSIIRVALEVRQIKGDTTFKVPESVKRDLSDDGIHGLFSHDDRHESSSHAIADHPPPSSQLEQQSRNSVRRSPSDDASKFRSIPGDESDEHDPNVDLVNRLFAASTTAAAAQRAAAL